MHDSPDEAYVDINDPILNNGYRKVQISSKYTQDKNKPEFKFKHFPLGSQKCNQLLKKNKTSTAEIPVQVLKRYGDICLPSLTDDITILSMVVTGRLNLGLQILFRHMRKCLQLIRKIIVLLSGLRPVSKIFERLLCNELFLFMKDKFSPLLCGYRKNYSAQHALIRPTERFKHCLDSSGVIVAVLMPRHKIVYLMIF